MSRDNGWFKLIIEPTQEQSAIINELGNCVVIAKPGSGKTYTLSAKIKTILQEVPFFRGIIAISFTNKASDELKQRCLLTGVDKKGTFFGTIDSFFFAEIIIPFGKHVFNHITESFDVKKIQEINEINKRELDQLLANGNYEQIIDNYAPLFCELFKKGIIILEAFGVLALYIIRSSNACKNYLQARYSHIMIDEYQDCGIWQNLIFTELVNIGICGVAVGDLDQSIFRFAKKDSRYLKKLAQNPQFITYSLSKNHRCHPSIVNYSLRLFAKDNRLVPTTEIRIFFKEITGSEKEIGLWLNKVIPEFCKKYQINELNRVGILVRSYRTGNIINKYLSIPHKLLINTPLDEDSSLWGGLFRNLLFVLFNKEKTSYEFLEEYLLIDMDKNRALKLLQNIKYLGDNITNEKDNHIDVIKTFIKIAKYLFPNARNSNAVQKLSIVLRSREFLNSYAPAMSNETQILTLHKAKGLEFDLVFHLDLYKWIMPMYRGDYEQDLNLHYVGITRARKCCVLCTSTQRTNSNNESKEGEQSEFLSINKINNLRLPSPL